MCTDSKSKPVDLSIENHIIENMTVINEHLYQVYGNIFDSVVIEQRGCKEKDFSKVTKRIPIILWKSVKEIIYSK